MLGPKMKLLFTSRQISTKLNQVVERERERESSRHPCVCTGSEGEGGNLAIPTAKIKEEEESRNPADSQN